MAPSGIEPATFRFVAQHLNHCATEELDKTKYPDNQNTLATEWDIKFVGCLI